MRIDQPTIPIPTASPFPSMPWPASNPKGSNSVSNAASTECSSPIHISLNVVAVGVVGLGWCNTGTGGWVEGSLKVGRQRRVPVRRRVWTRRCPCRPILTRECEKGRIVPRERRWALVLIRRRRLRIRSIHLRCWGEPVHCVWEGVHGAKRIVRTEAFQWAHEVMV